MHVVQDVFLCCGLTKLHASSSGTFQMVECAVQTNPGTTSQEYFFTTAPPSGCSTVNVCLPCPTYSP